MHEIESVRLLRAREAADYLAVSVGTLAKWRLSGTGPIFRKLGSRVAYDARDLATWLEARKRRSTSDRGER